MAAKAAAGISGWKPRPDAAGGDGPGKNADQPADAIAALREARRQLELLSQVLLRPSPQALDGCDTLLAAAARNLEASRAGWRKMVGDRHAAEEARRARQALDRARRLLDRAARFYAQWQRIRAAMSGYRSDGAPGQIPCQARIQVEG